MLLQREGGKVRPSRASVVAGVLALAASTLAPWNPTDDRPFFFLHVRSILDPPARVLPAGMSYSYWPVQSLRLLFYLLAGAAIAGTILPLTLVQGGGAGLVRMLVRRPQVWLYFAGIGAGFMLVELCLLQRYVLFLGHPTDASSVIIFSLLLFAEAGSATTGALERRHYAARLAPLALAGVVLLVAVQTWVVPRLLGTAMGWRMGPRVFVAVALLAPLGYVMGMAFPLGIQGLRRTGEEALTPYLWGINGVFSVFGSVLGTILAVSSGYRTGLLTGLAFYLGAMCMAVWGQFLLARHSHSL